MTYLALKTTLAAAAALQGGTTPVPDAPARNPNPYNPQLAIVGDFAGRLKGREPGERRFDFREIEFGFAADADPFVRAEVYVSLANEDGETEVELEEAFGRYNNLGRGLSARFGKFAAAVGRVQRNHADQLSYLEYPLVVQDALGEEGLRRFGGSLSYLFPGERYHEVTLEALDVGDDGPVFSTAHRDEVAWAAHYRTFFDFDEDLSAQLGASYLNGPSSFGAESATLAGIDYTMKWQPGQKGKFAQLEAEAYWTDPGNGFETAFGAFVRGVYEVSPRWFVTLGLDTSEIPGTSDRHRSWLAGLTLRPTEFHHWRLEFEQRNSDFGERSDRLTLQFQWLIGAHPAHKY